MKRIMAILLAGMMALACAACSDSSDTEATATKAAESTAASTGAPSTSDTEATPTESPAEETPTPTPEPEATPDAGAAERGYTIPYVTTGLVALYEGYFNTKTGLDASSKVWTDLSGNNRDVNMDDEANTADNYSFTDKGLVIDSQRIYLHEDLLEVVNGDEFTVEIKLANFEFLGTQFATFINNDVTDGSGTGNDNFSLFLRKDAGVNNYLEFKNAGNARPKVADNGGADLEGGATLTITFCLGEEVNMYVDGELIDTKPATSPVDANGRLFLGHQDASRNYSAEILSIRFYNVELSERQVQQNAAASAITAVTAA